MTADGAAAAAQRSAHMLPCPAPGPWSMAPTARLRPRLAALVLLLALAADGCNDGFESVRATCLGCAGLDQCHPCAAGTAGTGGNCSACAPGTQPNGASCAAKTGVTCAAPSMGDTACPDRPNDCVFSAGPPVELSAGVWSQQGSCATTSAAQCTSAGAGGTPPGSACAALKCTFTAERTRCAACGAGRVSSSGAACVACARGKAPWSGVAGWSGAVQCLQCPTGTHSSNGVACVPCAPGNVPNTMRTQCTQCQAGTYAHSSLYLCMDCPAGRFARAQSTACATCGDGFAADPSGVGCTACAAGRAGRGGTCEPCPVGWAPDALYGSTTCANCSLGGAAMHSDSTRCLACAPGRQASRARDGCERCTSGRVSAAGVRCSECAPGTVPIAASEATSCFSCWAGRFASNVTHTCEDCASGQYSVDRSPTCYACGVGYGVQADAGGCVACAAGALSYAGRCELCPPGRSPDAARAACEDCAGFGAAFHSSLVSGQCEACPPGRAPNVTRAACIGCQEGKYSATGAPCIACNAGWIPAPLHGNAAARCGPCAAGRYAVASGTHCEDCAPGRYAVEGSATAVGTHDGPTVGCDLCGDGHEPTQNQSSCRECAAATAGTDGTCAPCSPGRAPSMSRSECAQCGIGRYSVQGVQCVACWAGSEPDPQQQGCSACRYGLHSADGARCVGCRSGTVPNNFAAATDCSVCPAGRFADNRTQVCQPCPPGLYAGARSITCLSCHAGHTANFARSGCMVCPQGKAGGGPHGLCGRCGVGFAPNANRSKCEQCTGVRGEYADAEHDRCKVCPAGQEPSQRRDACVACVFGRYRDTGSNCTACLPGHEPNAYGSATGCLRCLDGYASQGERCERCPPNSAPTTKHHSTLVPGGSCVCAAGYRGEDGSGLLSCKDVDECTVGSFKGICNTAANYTKSCCSRFSKCRNLDGGFECAPCMQGFVGPAYGADGCTLAGGVGGSGSRAEAPEPYITLKMEAAADVAAGDPLAVRDFKRLVVAEVSNALSLSREHIEVTRLSSDAIEDDNSGGTSECQVTLDRSFSDIESIPLFRVQFQTTAGAMLGVEKERIQVGGIFSGSVIVNFAFLGRSDGSATSSALLLSRMTQHISNGSISNYFPTFTTGSWVTGQVLAVVDVTFKIKSGAGGDRTVVDLLLELNSAISDGQLGSIRLPAGQDVFDNLVMACPAGTYQNPAEGCVPCPAGQAPTSSQAACASCAVHYPMPNASSYASPDGRQCVLCPGGRSPDVARVICQACSPARVASGLGEQCGACQDRSTVPNTRERDPKLRNTACICPTGTVDSARLSSNREGLDLSSSARPPASTTTNGTDASRPVEAEPSRCLLCLPGFESAQDQTNCVRCQNGFAKVGGNAVCKPCAPEETSRTDRTACFRCSRLFTTPNAAGNGCRVSSAAIVLLSLLFLIIGTSGAFAVLRMYLKRTGLAQTGKFRWLFKNVYEIENNVGQGPKRPTKEESPALADHQWTTVWRRATRTMSKAEKEQALRESPDTLDEESALQGACSSSDPDTAQISTTEQDSTHSVQPLPLTTELEQELLVNQTQAAAKVDNTAAREAKVPDTATEQDTEPVVDLGSDGSVVESEQVSDTEALLQEVDEEYQSLDSLGKDVADHCYCCGSTEHDVANCPIGETYSGPATDASKAYGQHDSDWQQWLQRYIPEDIDVHEYLSSLLVDSDAGESSTQPEVSSQDDTEVASEVVADVPTSSNSAEARLLTHLAVEGDTDSGDESDGLDGPQDISPRQQIPSVESADKRPHHHGLSADEPAPPRSPTGSWVGGGGSSPLRVAPVMTAATADGSGSGGSELRSAGAERTKSTAWLRDRHEGLSLTPMLTSALRGGAHRPRSAHLARTMMGPVGANVLDMYHDIQQDGMPIGTGFGKSRPLKSADHLGRRSRVAPRS